MQYTLLIQCNLHTAYTIKCLYNIAYTPYTIPPFISEYATCIFTKGWTRARSTLCHRPTQPDSSGKLNSEARLGDGVSTASPAPTPPRRPRYRHSRETPLWQVSLSPWPLGPWPLGPPCHTALWTPFPRTRPGTRPHPHTTSLAAQP